MLKLSQQRSSRPESLRPFNLTNAANLNYETNRLQFNNSLMEPTNQRVDASYNDDVPDNTNDVNGSGIQNSNIWGKLGGVINGIRSNVATTFNQNNARAYRNDHRRSR